MKCDETYGLIIDYLAGELDDSSTAALMEHLADCRECSREFETLKRDWELTAKAFSPASKQPTVLTDAHKEKIYREISEKKSEKNILPFSKEPANKTIQFPKHLARIAALLILSVFLGFMIIPMMQKKDSTHQMHMMQEIVNGNSLYEDCDNEQVEHDAFLRPTITYADTTTSVISVEDFRKLPADFNKKIVDIALDADFADAATPSTADKEARRELPAASGERVVRMHLSMETTTDPDRADDRSEAHALSIAKAAPGGMESEARAKTRVINFFEEIPQEKRERSSHETARSNRDYFSSSPTYSFPPDTAKYNARLAVLDEIQPRTNEMTYLNFAPSSSVQNAYIIVKEENAKKDKLMPDDWSSKKGGLQPKTGTEKISEIRGEAKEEEAKKSIRADEKSSAPAAAAAPDVGGDMQTLSFVLNDARGASITQKKVEVPLLDLDANNAPLPTHQIRHSESNESVKKKIDWSNSVNTYLAKRPSKSILLGRLASSASFFNKEDTQIVLSIPDDLSPAEKQPGIFSYIVKSPFDLPDEYFIFVALIPDKNDKQDRKILDFDLNLFPSNSNIRMIQVQKTDLGNENMTLLTSFPQEMLSDPENALAVVLAKMDGEIGQPIILQADAVTGMISEAPPIVRLTVVNTFFNSKYRLNDKNINTLRNLTEDLLKTAYPGHEKLQKLKESLDQSVRK